MPKVSSAPPGRHSDALFLHSERRHVVVAATFGFALAFLIFLSGRHSIGFSNDPVCAKLDEKAGEIVARLLLAREQIPQSVVTEAIGRLRSARNHCRHGFVDFARSDYNALFKTNPDRAR